jgi:PAS domain S-box-containing protein
MDASSRYKRKIRALFFIVSLVPALTASAIWYVVSHNSISGTDFVSYSFAIVPIVLVGVIPAALLSYAFAELLAQPIKQLHYGITQIAKGNYNFKLELRSAREFSELGEKLNRIAADQQQIISQEQGQTELVAAERNKLSAILNSMTGGVLAIDHDNRILLVNKSALKITHRTIQDVAGRPLDEVAPFTQKGKPFLTRWIDAHLDSHDNVKEWRKVNLMRSDGTLLWADLQVVLLENDPNGIRGLLHFHDLTKAEQLEEMKVDFVAIAAHELRTPLATIRGYLDILENEAGKKLDADERQSLERSIAAATSLSGLVTNLLSVSRIEHGEMHFAPELVEWAKFMDTSLEDSKQRALTEKRKFVVTDEAKDTKIAIDTIGIKEVMDNFINNAINHTKEGGKIEVTAKRVGNDLEVAVDDDGTGIAKENIPKLFTKFYRIEGLKGNRGTGLGLFISKSIIEAHDGYVWVDSELGKGSTFGFRLPIKSVAPKKDTEDNTIGTIMRGTHGWIKEDSIR